MSDLWSTENKVLQGILGLSAGNGDIDVKPTRYILLTFWTSKKTHEIFHKEQIILKGFMGLMKYLSIMPYEEYGDIII